MDRITALMAALAIGAAGTAHAQLRVVTYNVAHLRGELSALQQVFLSLAADDRPGFAVGPHVYVMQEVHSGDVATIGSLLNTSAPAGTSFQLATYTNFDEDGFSGAQALFYRTDRLEEIAAAHADIFTGAGRFADRWKLRLVGYDAPAASFYVYGAHLKAGSSADDEQKRLDGVEALRDDAATLPIDSNVIYAGDFNLKGHDEPAFVALLATGASAAVDPLGGGTWSGPTHAERHTQSPRVASVNDLVGGGMDDRFDFQLVTSELADGLGLALIDGTYRALGNDGLHYNDDINDGNNFYYPDDVARSNALADALHEASDHIPVLADYQVPGVLAATGPGDLGRLILGAEVDVPVQVSNDALVVTPLGAATISYTVVGDGDVIGSCPGDAAPLAGPATCVLTLSTTSQGPADGAAVVFSNDQGVQNAIVVLPVTALVLRPSNASFAPDGDLDEIGRVVELAPTDDPATIEVAVHNLDFDELQSRLDVDGVTGLAAGVTLAAPLPSAIGGEAGALALSIDPVAAGPGTHELVLAVAVSDEDVPGATTAAMTLLLTVTIGDERACPADVTGDGAVDVDDLVAVILAWGPCESCTEDVDASGAVDVDDLVAVILSWGSCGS